MEELIEQFPEDDWVDQDLLTRDLAGELLDAEIKAEKERLESPDDADAGLFSHSDRRRRIAAMVAIRDRHRAPNTL
ncbi:hypothetical protein CJ178_16195 [Rhodococcus sp. ACPA4]|uniref:Uncharacterized protein n=3 Tax=Nocardiaceae TaxID=85025 RepID=A0A652YIA0_NOCGL|nr:MULTISPECIES: hypothetical protein [Rhodococcus]NMD64278.1 hypothetical protein [Nocardia globerula]MCE4265766.1 hypothetical protein [Rhodococcus globerulus]MDV6270536.1 hypothetical protein [Rhodococcus globerulus]MDV8071048.1 hypothetical protein [Rhodococcus sp. IEGM 1366]NRI69980.1 hypothetical protein [Rhodococcus sp. MS16]